MCKKMKKQFYENKKKRKQNYATGKLTFNNKLKQNIHSLKSISKIIFSVVEIYFY